MSRTSHPFDNPNRKPHERVSGPPQADTMPDFPGKILPPELWTQPEIRLSPDDALLDLESLFPESRPLLIELGSGKGRFLIAHALAHPDMNHIGVEQVNKYYQMMARRVSQRGLSNAKVLRDDARQFIMQRLPEKSVSECHIYHPDPWPKKRHHKRRLVRPRFLAKLCRILQPNGKIVFQTDHPGLWRYSRRILEEFFHTEEQEGPWQDSPEGRTNYEIKAIRAGWPVFRLTGIVRKHLPDHDKVEELETLSVPEHPEEEASAEIGREFPKPENHN